jgi:acetoin utilization protein AcuC
LTGSQSRGSNILASQSQPPRFIGSEIYRGSTLGSRHPLSIPRVSTCIDLCRLLGWLPDEVYIDSPCATADDLARFHDRDYIAAVIDAERRQTVPREVRQRYDLGRNGNPIYPEVFRRPATACGASILAGQMLGDPAGPDRVIYSPAGGTHHGRPDRASGFCTFNDPVLGILSLLDRGLTRVFYLDVDAHHGDGVQAAFHEDQRVMTFSIHEEGRWPMKQEGEGSREDRAGGLARNIPVPPGFNDSEMDYILEAAVLPILSRFAPEAVVIQCGADALEEDPLSKLALGNGALWRVIAAVKALAPRLLVLGGGGYNLWSVGRCWTGVWATLNGFEVPDRLPGEAEALLRAITWRDSKGRHPPGAWFTTLADRPRPGPLRLTVREAVAAILSS